MNSKGLLIAFFLVSSLLAFASPMDDTLNKKISVNFKDLDAKSALGLLSEQVGVPISVSSEINLKLTYTGTDLPVKQVLDEVTSENGLTYSVQGNEVQVRSSGSAASSTGSGNVHSIPLRYANGNELLPKVSGLLSKSSKVMYDETSNSIIFLGPPEDYDRLAEVVGLLDSAPKQILIQGLIIETNETFLQNIGFSYNVDKAMISTKAPTGANLTLQAATVAGHNLNLNIAAAESRGDAKVISRPKVVTLNNKAAQLSSGLTISVKTLSTVQTAQPGQAPVAATGGLTQVNAGLTVNITPTIVGDGKIRLALAINSSTPDNSQAVDGIPGVNSNSANTTVIVDDDRTAIIAGLIKQSKSHSHDGVPLLMDIPILGALFRSDNRSDQNNELAIFITPSILKTAMDSMMYPTAPSPRELLNNVGEPTKPRLDNQYLGSPAP